jgi:NADH:ubiquinone oxidoreductase subunit H
MVKQEMVITDFKISRRFTVVDYFCYSRVAFLTLLERRVLGHNCIRKGHNMVGFTGILQLFSDLIQLFLRNSLFPLVSNYGLFIFPIFSLFLSLLVWLLIPYFRGFISFQLGLLFFLCVL